MLFSKNNSASLFVRELTATVLLMTTLECVKNIAAGILLFSVMIRLQASILWNKTFIMMSVGHQIVTGMFLNNAKSNTQSIGTIITDSNAL